jgi:hypothetical protein
LDRLRQLYRDHRDEVAFLLVYIRHGYHAAPQAVLHAYTKAGLPEGTPAHRRRRIAVGLAALQLPFPCVFDSEDRTAETLYDAFPSRLVVVGRDGRVVLDAGRGLIPDSDDASHWDYDAIEKALERQAGSTVRIAP